MARGYKDLREYLTALEGRGWLRRVGARVNPRLEITEITDRVTKAGGPALLFEQVEGSTYPVLTNAFGSMDRVCLALGVESLDDLGREIRDLLRPPEVSSLWDKLRALPRLAELGNLAPRLVRNAPCQEVVEEEPDLSRLPVLHCWPQDGGPFITLPLVISRDPLTGRRNVGMYRMQVYDSRTTGMHWHRHKHGAEHLDRSKGRLEVAVALGGDPATIYAATAPLPAVIDEFTLAGFLRGAPVELVKARTVDLEVPAQAEFILEGYVEVGDLRREGPFGDHTGFYSLADEYPVFHLTCLTRRGDPIYPATVVGRPVEEDYFLGKVTERLFLPLLQMQLPEVLDINLPAEGVFHNCLLISIEKRYPGQAKKVMHAVWGLGLMMLTKLIVVVDAEVDVQDLSEVAWATFNNVDARRDLVVVDGPVDALDHAAPLPHYGAKLGVDGTRKWPSEGIGRPWPDPIEMSPEVRDLVTRRWKEYGLE